MLYEDIAARLTSEPVTFSIVGAGGQFGRSLFANLRRIPGIVPQVLCDVRVDALAGSLREAGYSHGDFVRAEHPNDVARALESGKLVLVSEADLAVSASSHVLVEATGHPETGIDVVNRGIEHGSNIVMVNKEADSVAGPALAAKAHARNLRYSYAHGDQPRNLIELVAWARLLGFDIVAAGKASEYDYVYDPSTKTVRYLDRSVHVPELDEWWNLSGDIGLGLSARSRLLSSLPQATPPDYGEMSLVANATGLRPSSPEFHYPLARTTELADIYSPRAVGGVLESGGVVDVFNMLRRTDEPSFAGGVFVVVRVSDRTVWDVLRQKGHIVSRSGEHACVYLPYHLMGLETPLSIIGAALDRIGPDPAPSRRQTVVVAETVRDFRAGEMLAIEGAHHEIDGTRALILGYGSEHADKLPYYLAGDHRLVCDVPAGTILTEKMVDLPDGPAVRFWRESNALE